MKYYAVKNGLNPGIYETWEECQRQVLGFKGAIYKSFSNLEEAKNYLNDTEEVRRDLPTVYVDGSYDLKTGNYSFGGILMIGNEILKFQKAFPKDEFSNFRNVAGEIRGAAYIINYCIKNNIKEINLCYDYLGIENWYKDIWQAKTKISLAYIKFRDKVKDKIKINFIKIKSHSNNKYNDLADKLAKEVLGL